jgi:hypothetical protein
MSEQQMRQRVFRFLKARMRNMIMPATVGIGLAVAGGCTESSVSPTYAAPVYNDAAAGKQDVPRAPDLAAPDSGKPDSANPDSPVVADVAADSLPDVPSPLDTSPSDALAGETGVDMRRLDSPIDMPPVKYGSPFDSGILDSQSEAGQVIAKYIAPIPDAGVDTSGPVTRYMAVMPDASPDLSVAALYMAPRPS